MKWNLLLLLSCAALLFASLLWAADPPVPPSSRPARTHAAVATDFPDSQPVSPVAPAPSTQSFSSAPSEPSARPALPPADDPDVARAIDHAVGFLLSQFRDNDLSTARELSEPQRQSLYALCVYALAQTGQCVDDPRISIKAKTLPPMLDRLKTFNLVSDVETTNRPVTYGRALRAAALATYDRPADRAALKADVAWLVQAQFDGAYTYDDFYNDLLKKGMKGSSRLDDPKTRPDKHATPIPFTGLASLALGGLLVGDNPYPPPGNFTAPPPGVGGVGPGKNGNFIYQAPNYNTPIAPNYIKPPAPNYVQPLYPNYIRPTPAPYVPNWPRPTVPWWHSSPPRSNAPSPNYIGPHVPNKPGPSSAGGGITAPASVRPLGDGNTPPPQLDFQFPWDNSNSQYGVLGVFAGLEAGVEVPTAYWQSVQFHWTSCQLPTGQWCYSKGDPKGTLAMTAGGVASLLITHEVLDLPMLKGQVGREPYSPHLARALAWMEKASNAVDTPTPSTHYLGYDLFGVSRVGLSSGYKYFGDHDWYRELSTLVVHAQFPNGAWGREDLGVDAVIDTAYSLLFLARGRPPVLMTKLKFERYWDNRPRDVANLALFASKQLERRVNWQVVGIEHTWDQWFDSPVLYLASHAPPRLKDRDYAELSKFAWAGGLLFTHADGGSGNFDHWVAAELAPKIAPGRKLVPIPDSDPLFSALYKIPNHRPLMGVSNGARWLLVHSPSDLSLAWQMRSEKTRPADLQLGLNLFVYAAGRVDLRNRLESPFVPAPPFAPNRTVRVARLSYEGNWDPEPAAWHRFSRVLHWETGTSLELTSVPVEKLDAKTAPLAVLTGTGSQTFTKSQCEALYSYVKSGGVLLIDPCAGDNDFRLGLRENLLPTAFPGAKPIPLPPELAVPLRLRPFSSQRHGQSQPQLELLSLGKGRVLFSPVDLTSGLLGTNAYAVDGYQPASAEALLQRLVVWADKQAGKP